MTLPLLASAFAWSEPATYVSHAPMRPLPAPFDRSLSGGSAYYVDARHGDDAAQGTEAAPWKSVNHSLAKLKPGDTLLLRGGTYYESVTCTVQGTQQSPITIRAYPNELAILDGGYREFYEKPAEAWEPFKEGAKGEYRSVRVYPELAEDADARWPVVASGANAKAVKVLGNFGDSMIPLHGYFTPVDLRTDNCYWTLDDKLSPTQSMYCGPGVWYATDTHRIHIRLAPTTLVALGEANYRGETDPRKLSLVIGGATPALDIRNARNVHLQDLVIRGTRSRTVNVTGSDTVTFDGLTIYGGAPALFVEGTRNLTVFNCAFRGVSTPWSFRSSEKYRGISTYLFIASGLPPGCANFEMAFNEFTDCHDGLIISSIDGLDLHDNHVDGFNDDALYLTAIQPMGYTGRNIRIYRNHLSRSLSMFSFAGEGKETGQDAAWIYRNVIDLRAPVLTSQGRSPESATEYVGGGRTWGDHGSPIWRPMRIYHNTIVTHDPMWRGYYGTGLCQTRGSEKILFNNIFAQIEDLPGLEFPPDAGPIQADGNLHWSVLKGPLFAGDFFEKFRASKRYEESKAQYAPGWTAQDIFADPGFVKLAVDWRDPCDFRLGQKSPAINKGIAIPQEWPDPLRDQDKGAPDMGAMPYGSEGWGVGVRGRISANSGHMQK